MSSAHVEICGGLGSTGGDVKSINENGVREAKCITRFEHTMYQDCFTS